MEESQASRRRRRREQEKQESDHANTGIILVLFRGSARNVLLASLAVLILMGTTYDNSKRIGAFSGTFSGSFNTIEYFPRRVIDLLIDTTTSVNNNDNNGEEDGPPVTVFYNLYASSLNDLPRVAKLARSQLSRLKGGNARYSTIYIKSIGAVTNASMLELFDKDDKDGSSSSSIHNITATESDDPNIVLEHFDRGDESLSLHSLWEFCRQPDTHRDQKIVYLHSKGSFHDTPQNTQLREYITTGALSKECFDAPDTCNVCSNRMSPLPHPHTAGNMWLARCSYIAKLIDPLIFTDAMRQYTNKRGSYSCIGVGRYSQEHWVHSHPEIAACDTDNSSSYVWNYGNVPEPGTYTLEVKAAPRHKMEQFKLESSACNEHGLSQKYRINEYVFLYQQLPPPTWFGWHFYANDTFFEG